MDGQYHGASLGDQINVRLCPKTIPCVTPKHKSSHDKSICLIKDVANSLAVILQQLSLYEGK